MRPRRLELEGFASFRDRTCLEFGRDLDLFVFAGRTGSGKSTLLDALVFSLYGSVPRYPSKNWVAPVVSQGLNQARVRLTFEVGDALYAATRVVRRTDGGASTREARLERLADGDVVATLAGSASELTEEVERLLGLSFDHFVRTVVLPQGAFQEFLHARPSERQDLLVELLGLDVYRQVATLARTRGREAEQAADLLERRLEGGPGPEALEAARERVAVLRGLEDEVTRVRPRLEELRERGGRLAEVARNARRRADRLADLRVPEGVDELTARRRRADEAVEAARERLREAEERLETVEAAQDALPDPGLLDAVRRLRRRARELDERAEAVSVRRQEAEERLEQAEGRLQQAQAAAAGARERLEAVRRADLAATLAAGLEAGEDCPVCDRPLAEPPRQHELGDHTAAQQRLERAETAVTTAAEAVREAEIAAAGIRSRRARLAEEREEVVAELAGAERRLEGELGGAVPESDVLEEIEQELAETGRRLESTRAEVRSARQGRRDAEADRDRVIEAQTAAWHSFDEVRDRLGGLEPPPVDRDDLAGSWSTLVAWADRRRPELEKDAAEAEAAVTEVRSDYQQVHESLVSACREHDVEVGERPPGEAVAAALQQATGRAERIEAELDEARELRERAGTRRAQARLARDLGSHLSARNFERWLLERALRRLVVGATEVLQQLTGGIYSLVLDDGNQFAVVDHRNADQTRSARTLSGGETFLASLSLALALSEHVAELAAGSSARLEALFLDEGFGALDADTLDTVAAAIEELGARGRMVGLITHVRDLADRIPVRFEVHKTVGGSRVEKVVS